jgi:hypothetical protein
MYKGLESGSHIAKGPLCYYLDALSRGTTSVEKLSALRKAIQDLSDNGYNEFVKVFREHVFDEFKELTPDRKTAIVDYLVTNWFNEESGWWPHLQPIEPVLCLGLIKALDISIQEALPIDSYWVVIDEGFELTVSQSPQQVTLLIMTPQPPRPRAHGVWSPHDTKIWVVKDDRIGGELEDATRWGRTVSRGRVMTVRVRRPSEND